MGAPLISHAPDPASQKRATAIYGETSGLFPQLLPGKKNPYDAKNWGTASFKKLQTARAYVGVVSDRNAFVYRSMPSSHANSIEKRAWSDAIYAATATKIPALDARINHFFLRQIGNGVQIAPWPELQRYLSLGPFINVGGGDVPKGSATYIDFYGK